MEKKYEMIKNGKYFTIRALRDFGCVHKGDFGGLIQSEKNLSHEGDCWIEKDAYVIGNAVVSENAHIGTGSLLMENAQVRGNAYLLYSYISENAIVEGNAQINRNASIGDETHISGDVTVYYSNISGKSIINGNCMICGHGFLKNAFICRNTDVVFVNCLGPDNSASMAFYLCEVDKQSRICVCNGEQCWMLDEFVEYVTRTYSDSFRAQTYRMAAKMAKFQIVQGFKAARDEEKKRAGMIKTDPGQQTAEVVSAPKAVEIAPSQKAAETVPTETLEKTA